MRAVVIRIVIVAALGMGLHGGGSERTSPLEGAWELVEAKSTPPDQTFTLADWHQVKILTKTHWAFLAAKRMPPRLTSLTDDSELLAAAKAFGAGGGTYTLVGDTYTEHVEYF